jgi:hypothetical protein
MVVIFRGGDNGIQVSIYAPMSMAIMRSGKIALLVTS